MFPLTAHFGGSHAKNLFVVFLAMVLVAGTSMAESGIKKRRPPPRDFGRVVIDNYSEREQLAPVVFDHWIHRSMYTCSVCHGDLGFAMRANETEIKAADNIRGDYCGACHNGKTTYAGVRVFAACSARPNKEEAQRCSRCHSLGRNMTPKYDFASFAEKLPKQRFGNGVDWVEAERSGLIKLVGSLEATSAKKSRLAIPVDTVIVPNAGKMPDIVFSHEKHSVWNGCDLCHPDVFPSVRKDERAVYSMNEIFDGKYCGVCHGKVSFPMIECQKCHSKPVTDK